MNTQTAQTETRLAVSTVLVRAVIVTGTDERGNEYAYTRTDNGWLDIYNECEMAYVPLHMNSDSYVRFGELKMSGSEWVALGCPVTMEAALVDEILTAQGYAEGEQVRMEAARAELLAECEHDAQDADWRDAEDTKKEVFGSKEWWDSIPEIPF